MEQLSLFPERFKKGDRVVILSKSIGVPLGRSFAYWLSKGDVRKIARVRVIDSENTDDRFRIENGLKMGDVFYTIEGAAFLHKDLKLVRD